MHTYFINFGSTWPEAIYFKNAFSRIKVGKSHFKAFPLDYPLAKTGETVNGGALAPFILTVDWLDWLCYLPSYAIAAYTNKTHLG